MPVTGHRYDEADYIHENYASTRIEVLKPASKITTANGMPINNRRYAWISRNANHLIGGNINRIESEWLIKTSDPT